MKYFGKERTYTLPDATISVEEMNEYGYMWDGMLPLRKETSEYIWQDMNLPIYCLYEDNTEAQITSLDELQEHAANGGLFGIDKTMWQSFIQNNKEYEEDIEK